MKPFLKEVAEVLYRQYGNRLNELCLVFPNRRAGLFFNRYLAGLLHDPVWSPSVLTIRELMVQFSALEYADELELITRLYQCYTALQGTKESFDEFFYWGEMMLGDFDETDKYMAEASDLFMNIRDLKEIDQAFDYLDEDQLALIRRFWGEFRKKEPSREETDFLEIWKHLLPLYNNFRSMLREAGIGYEGMIYREAAECLRDGGKVDTPAERYVFIGFNALSNSEKQLFKFFDHAGKGLFYWDYDEFYLENEWHEAGRFIRENLQQFRDDSADFPHDLIRRRSRRIDIFSVPSGSGQAQVVHRILADLSDEHFPAEETAIVLADEELLIPLLQALPETLGEINVTMGYPISATPVFSLLERLIDLQLRIARGDPSRFRHDDVLAVLQHQYVLLQAADDARRLSHSIQRENRRFLSAGELSVNTLFSKIFKRLEHPGEIADYLLEILEMITREDQQQAETVDEPAANADADQSAGSGSAEHRTAIPPMEWEFIFQLYTRIKRLKDVLARLENRFGLPTFLRIFHKYLQRIRIPFRGEPLRGIQVMGVLETRILDFDRIIMLSMNEGSFPRSDSQGSFIPHHLRLGFGLPTHEHRDAIYAYYFYRLLHRASMVSLLYNNIADGMRTGERSRYLYQLAYHPGFEVERHSVGFEVQARSSQRIRISKHPSLLQELERRYISGQNGSYLSPSALNHYIDCSLRFYFRYIAGIEEPDEIRENIDHVLFGSLLHEVLHSIYAQMPDPLTDTALEDWYRAEERIDGCIEEAFHAFFPDVREDGHALKGMQGRNLVFKAVMHAYARQILSIDKAFSPLQIYSLEKEYLMVMGKDGNENVPAARIGGKIDRVDRVGEVYRVIDYKTGSGEMVFRDVASLFDGSSASRNRAAFQTLLYTLLLRDEPGFEMARIMPAVYLIRNVYQADFRVQLGMGTPKKHQLISDDSPLRVDFLRHLQSLITTLFDPHTAFEQTPQTQHCRLCPYRRICQR